jgi:DNA-binding beta-propeller fold protein YncE
MSTTVSSALRTASVLKALRKAAQITTLGLGLAVTAHAASPSFYEFESGHVRPLAMSTDGTRLFAVNTPNGTLDIFRINGTSLTLEVRVPVGMEPVAVAQRTDNEVWVVNHLSDSVSIVSLNGTPRVTRTLLVGDEPRDIVFAGSPARAFITTAHRGQQLEALKGVVDGAKGAQLTTPGVGRADVWVFDAANTGNTLGGTPLKIMSFFADTPRALTVSPDKKTVYVAAHKSGNQTASINEEVVCDGFEKAAACTVKGVKYPGGAFGPSTNAEGKRAPEVGIIVKYNNTTKRWEDLKGRVWDQALLFTLPDKDVFAFDPNTLTEKAFFTGVGTTLFNMVANPVTGALYVTNLEANNMGLFEGDGKFGGYTLQGKIAQARVTVIANGQVKPRHLNKHIDYSKLARDPGFDTTQKNHSLALPQDVAVTKDGKTMYVTAYGSNKIGVFNTVDIENDTFNPKTASANYIKLSSLGGPSGVVLDENRGQMYVMSRFDSTLTVINMSSRTEVSKTALVTPEPANIIEGRPFLYDATLSSANGESACASCHIFGDMDDLAWNLGNPGDKVTKSPIPGKFTDGTEFQGAKLIFGPKTPINGSGAAYDVHPLKGPMATQTLRGMRNQGAMHWRGDRAVGMFGTSPNDSLISFKNFAVAFEGLLGNPEPMSEANMQKFADYQLNVMMPPNPIRNLDNSLTAQQKRGFDFYFGSRPSDGFKISIFGTQIASSNNCNGCHTIDGAKGFFGTGQMISFEGITQIFKVPHLRNMYLKAGRFGSPAIPFSSQPSTGPMGDQVRGYGFVHDGTADTLAHFFTVRVFNPTLNSGFPLFNPNKTRADVAEYMHAVDSDLAPIVGQQVTLDNTNAAVAGARVDLLIARAKAAFVSKELGGAVTECDLVASVVEGGTRRGYFFDTASSNFVAQNGATKSDGALRALAGTAGQEVTYTCVVPGSGRRIAYTAAN